MKVTGSPTSMYFKPSVNVTVSPGDPLLFQVWRVQHDEFSVIGVVGHRQGDEHGVRAVLVDRASCHRRTLDMELSIHDVRGIMVCCHRFYLRRVA